MSCLYLQVAVTKLWTVLKNKRKKKKCTNATTVQFQTGSVKQNVLLYFCTFNCVVLI